MICCRNKLIWAANIWNTRKTNSISKHMRHNVYHKTIFHNQIKTSTKCQPKYQATSAQKPSDNPHSSAWQVTNLSLSLSSLHIVSTPRTRSRSIWRIVFSTSLYLKYIGDTFKWARLSQNVWVFVLMTNCKKHEKTYGIHGIPPITGLIRICRISSFKVAIISTITCTCRNNTLSVKNWRQLSIHYVLVLSLGCLSLIIEVPTTSIWFVSRQQNKRKLHS